jgi:hypothetical protein
LPRYNAYQFGSDNHSGIHPAIIQAIEEANTAYQPSYGEDEYTAGALKEFQRIFGSGTRVFFAFNGTGANVLCLKALTQPHNAIIVLLLPISTPTNAVLRNVLPDANSLTYPPMTANYGLRTFSPNYTASGFSITPSQR